jgi:hypothetical protein
MKTILHIKRNSKPGFFRIPQKRQIKAIRFLTLLGCLFILSFSFSSCEKGELGQPGYAFVAFAWVDAEPDYIEIANEFIPAVFYWDWFYRVDPGLYAVYYEVKHNRRAYAWELEYEVWENPGKRAKYVWLEPTDGPDAYFTIELSPYGPEVIYEEVKVEKQGFIDDSDNYHTEIGQEVILEKQHEDYNLHLRYKRVEPRNIK